LRARFSGSLMPVRRSPYKSNCALQILRAEYFNAVRDA
jgi:hypothetical protein